MSRAWSALLLFAAACAADDEPLSFVAVTFNAGTTEGLAHDRPPDDGYDSALATISDAHYGNGLAWEPAVARTRAFFNELKPDIVAFQEIFDSNDCPNIPAEFYPSFVCSTWQLGDPTVALDVLGPDYQLACHPGKADKCLAVRSAFGTFEGDLSGEGVDGCGRGARVATGVIRLADGSALQVVNVHGSSGLSDEDVACRTAQFEQAFGAPAERSVVLGDLNTDPLRFYDGDESAKTFRDRSQSAEFKFVTEVGEDAPPTYGGVVNIDHLLTNFADGTCWFGGDGNHPVVTDAVYFDHRPIVCTVTAQP